MHHKKNIFLTSQHKLMFLFDSLCLKIITVYLLEARTTLFNQHSLICSDLRNSQALSTINKHPHQQSTINIQQCAVAARDVLFNFNLKYALCVIWSWNNFLPWKLYITLWKPIYIKVVALRYSMVLIYWTSRRYNICLRFFI